MIKRVFFLFLVGSILWAYTSCKKEQKIIKPLKIEFKKEGELTFFKSTSDSAIANFDIEIADNDYETETGLMHRLSMGENRGMLFVFPNMRIRSFYMKNTLIPLDIIYIDKDKFIVSIQKNAIPLDEKSLPSKVPAQYVLEINAGLAKTLPLKVGDRIDYKAIN